MPKVPSEKSDEANEGIRPAVSEQLQSSGNEDDTAAVQLSNASVSTHSEASGGEKHPLAFLSPPQSADEMGRLSGYRVLKLLGEGGMGLVFEAEDLRLERRVALKVMKPEIAAKEQHRARFVREARTAAKVEHDHICPIYQVGEENGVPFIAMPFLKGEPLDIRLKRQKPLPIGEAIRIGRDVAEGLAAAHDAGLVHRDIKPGNIWLEEGTRKASGSQTVSSRVKILDFGLARLSVDDIHLTQSGAIMGTPAYMAPEQARGKSVDLRADLFSLGVVLYEMTTGKRPFTGSDTMSILTSLAVDEPIAPNLINFAISPALSDLIMQLLSKTPEKRPADGRVVAEALMAILMQTAQPFVESIAPSAAPPLASRVDATSVDPWSAIDDTNSVAAPAADSVHRDAEPARPAKPQAAPGRSRLSVALAALVIFLAGGGFATYKVFFETKDGTLVVEVEGDADVRFKNGKLEIYGEDGKLRYTLEPSEKNKSLLPGKYLVKIVGVDGIKLDAPEFVMEKNGKVTVRVIAERVAVAKKEGFLAQPISEAWLKEVATLPPAKQVEAVGAKLKERNKDFDGKVTLNKVEDRVVTDVSFYTGGVSDISPVRALVGLKVLSCAGLGGIPNKLSDLTPLKGMKLTKLDCNATRVSDLTPLKDMKLTYLNCDLTQVSDLTPLKDIKLTHLNCARTKVSELSPLKGMKLVSLNCGGTLVSDLTPLKDMPLEELLCDSRLEVDIKTLRTLKKLAKINGKAATQFWEELDLAEGPFEEWLKKVASLPTAKQIWAVNGRLRMLNPGWGGSSTVTLNKVEGGMVTDVSLTGVTDISPLRAFVGLKVLSCTTGGLSDLTPLKDMKLDLLVCANTQVSDLSPLKGMPLKILNFGHTKVSDLSPLKGMPLTRLLFNGTNVSDLSPLKDMNLESLACTGTQVANLSPLNDMKLTHLHCKSSRVFDLSPLRGMPLKDLDCDFKPERDAEILRAIKTLETINGKPAAEVLKEVAAAAALPPLDPAWLKAVAAMPADKQLEAVKAELMKRNPGFDGKLTHGLNNAGQVTALSFVTDKVTDISPVRAMTYLSALVCNGTYVLSKAEGKLADLSPLKNMNLTTLHFSATQVADLSPLKGMKLMDVHCAATQVSDLSALKDMKLTGLTCDHTKVTDLTPLKDMKLTYLSCNYTPVSDLSPLKDMPLTILSCVHTSVSDLSPLKNLKLTYLGCSYTKVSDLSPLKSVPLQNLDCDMNLPERHAAILRAIKTLETINNKPAAEVLK